VNITARSLNRPWRFLGISLSGRGDVCKFMPRNNSNIDEALFYGSTVNSGTYHKQAP
jgi:hypothetical protein